MHNSPVQEILKLVTMRVGLSIPQLSTLEASMQSPYTRMHSHQHPWSMLQILKGFRKQVGTDVEPVGERLEGYVGKMNGRKRKREEMEDEDGALKT